MLINIKKTNYMYWLAQARKKIPLQNSSLHIILWQEDNHCFICYSTRCYDSKINKIYDGETHEEQNQTTACFIKALPILNVLKLKFDIVTFYCMQKWV